MIVKKRCRKFYLDVGANHNQSLPRAKKIIQELGRLKRENTKSGLKNVEITGVKFQVFNHDNLFRNAKINKIEELKKTMLPVHFIPALIAYAKGENLEIGFTPFGFDSLKTLKPYSRDIYYKVSAFDTLRFDFIQAIKAQSQKPMHLSFLPTHNKDEFNHIRNVIGYENVFYHCVSKYPAKANEVFLKSIKQLPYFGYSDHTANIAVILAAFNYYDFFELHIDLDDMQGAESKHGHVWSLSKLKQLLILANDYENANQKLPIDSSIYDLRFNMADPSDGLRPLKKDVE